MNRLSRLIKTKSPGWLTEAVVFLQMNVAPAAFYRRQSRLLRQAGRPETVLHGPFRGMTYTKYAADKALVPRLFGTYECEIHGAVERFCEWRPDVVAIAGSGEGYYAVGLARRLPDAKVFAYDGFKWARHLLQQMTKLNHVEDRLESRGLISPEELARTFAAAKRPAIVCDVDGYELDLLDPVKVPRLADAAILLELHHHVLPNVTEEITRRFGQTHNIEHIWDRPRTLEDLPPGVSLPQDEALWGIDEMKFRGVRQSWMLMLPSIANEQAKAA